MKTTIIQLDIEWGSPLTNIRRVERLITEAPGNDLYVLPEMWSTGFATEPDGIAESESTSVSLSWMRTTARRLNCAISGSLAIAISNHKVLGDAKRQSRAQSSKFKVTSIVIISSTAVRAARHIMINTISSLTAMKTVTISLARPIPSWNTAVSASCC